MGGKNPSIEQIIEAAVKAACDCALRGVEDKIQAAINLGVSIGAAAGAEAGAAAAIKAAEREKKKVKKAFYDKRLHNTKLLLKHYRTLNEHYKNAVYELTEEETETDDTFTDIMAAMERHSDEKVFVASIKNSARRTEIIMTHINKMLDVYEQLCKRSSREDAKRHYRVLRALYLDEVPTTAADIALIEGIDKRTVYKDISTVAADLTMLFFGVDGIENF